MEIPKATILLVEDEAIIAMSRQQQLEREGYSTVTVGDGKTAVDYAIGGDPCDLILMDIDLGKGIDGITAAEQILAERHLPIVFLTGHQEPEIVDRVRTITRYGYVLKTAGLFVLVQAINVALELFAAHRRMERNELRYRTLFENDRAAVAVYRAVDGGEDFEFTEFNRGAERIDGQKREEVLGHTIREMRPGVEETGLLDAFRTVLTHGKPMHVPLFHYDGRGCVHGWYDNYVYRITDEEIVAVFTDETDRIQQERNALKYRTLFETLGAAIFVHDLEGRILDVNDVPVTKYGYDRETLLSGTVELFDVGLPPEKIGQIINTVVETGEVRFETVHSYADGTPIDVEVDARRLDYDDGVAVLSVCHDITERKRTERRLQESEESFRTLFDGINDAVLVHPLRKHGFGTFVQVNRVARERYGYSIEEFLRLSPKDISSPESVRSRGTEEARQRLRDEGQNIFEVCHIRKDGTELPVEISSNVARIEGRDVIISVARDISERKRAERELEESNRELEQFAYVASHDLREPLRMISSFAQLLAERYRGKLDGKADRYIFRITDGAERMQELIDNLLDYSRIGTRGKPFRTIDINTTVRRVLEGIQIAINEVKRETPVSIHVDPLPEVSVDETQIGRLFQNLIENALKFRRPEQPVSISISAERHDGGWRFAVSDNGIGIEPAYREKIFLIFQRLHTREEYDGNGIGLSVCKRIVQRHGGEMDVESTLGQGSTFRFTIPDRKETAEART